MTCNRNVEGEAHNPRGIPRARPTRLAFTLIEMLAVLLIMALVAGLTLPNLSLRSDRAVLEEAQELAASFAFTRQRAVATAAPHRVVLDLDRSAYWIEEQPERSDAFATPPSAPPAKDAARPIRLVAPATGPAEFQPVPGPFGRPRLLREPVHFESVETPAGAVREGQVQVVFEDDGTADYTVLVLANEDGDAYVLELRRLADEVGIHRE